MRVWAASLILLAPGAAHAQTLAETLDAAYRNNPTLVAARLNARGADENITQARAAYLPQVDLNASAGFRRSDVDLPGGLREREDTEPQTIGVAATQPLYTGGFRGAQSDLARAQSLSARENLRSVEQQVLLAVIAAYEDVRRDVEVVRIRQNDADVLARQLQAANDRFEVGEITRTDVAQAEARFAGAQAGLSTAQADLEASRANFVRLVGEQPVNLAAPPPNPPLPQSLDEALATARENNPDLGIAEESVRAARSQVGIERSQLLPQVSIVAGLNRAVEQQGPDIESEAATVAAQFSMPLFEGGYGRSRIRQSRFNAGRAEAEAEAVRRLVEANVVAAWNDVQAATRIVASAREQARANAFALEGVETEQMVGLRTTLDVLNAQQEYLNSQLAVVQAERDQYVAAHALLSTIGALNAATLAVNAPLYDPDQPPHDMRGMLPWQGQGESP
ncbi:MAG: TolC family outer membrane protein [Hyphomonadaceae bacterium]